MITCPYCREHIPDDCWYCDQCGHELMFCPECKAPKKGTSCPACGETLVNAELFYTTQTNNSNTLDKASGKGTLYLNGMGIHQELIQGEFGRIGGAYPNFSELQYISRKHGKFEFMDGKWYVMDLGSTNGTQLNGKPLVPNKFYHISSGDKITIAKHNHFVVE